MPAVKQDFIGKRCKLALHSAGQTGITKEVLPLRHAAGVLTYEDKGRIFHTTLPYVIEELPEPEKV
jgi:hypothetical protein